MANFTFWVTEDCNLRCTYCYVKKQPKVMNLETAKMAVDFVQRTVNDIRPDEVNVMFHGGEPMLNFGIVEYLTQELENRLGASITIRFFMTTNGTIQKKEYIDFVKRHKFNITVSLDGKKKQHDMCRIDKKGNGSYEKAVKMINQLNHSNMFIRVRMTITEQTVNSLSENYEYFYRKGYRGLTFTPDYTVTSWTKAGLIKYSQEYLKIIEFLKSYDKKAYTYFIKNIGICNFRNMGICDGGRQTYHISSTGYLFPCAMVTDDAKFCLGNVFTGINLTRLKVFDSIINADNYSCDKCALKKHCIGNRCKYINYADSGNYYMPSAVQCTVHKVELNILRKNREVLVE